jgi:hypothetical protein
VTINRIASLEDAYKWTPVMTDTPPSTAAQAYARDLSACLDAKDSSAALIAFMPQVRRAADLPRALGSYSEVLPHPLTGVALMLVAGALVEMGRGREIIPFISGISDLFAPPHRYYAPGSNLSDILSRFPFLDVPLTRGAIVDREQRDAVLLCLRYAGHSSNGTNQWIFGEPAVAAMLAHPAASASGPWAFDRAWLLEQQEQIRAIAPLDGRLERSVEFDQLLLENALLIEQPERGLPAFGLNGIPDAEFLTRAHLKHLGFNAVCVLAALKRDDEAIALARHISRRGYGLRWRFKLEQAAETPWTQAMRQNEWLAALSETPDYKAFLASDIQWAGHDANDPVQTAICSVREGIWGGKKKTKCFISKASIQPGESVIRIRRMRGCSGFDDFDVASKAGIAGSVWQAALDAFETNAVPLQRMLGTTRYSVVSWDVPEISAFHYDTVPNPERVDIARAVAIIAAHNPPPIRRTWIKGPERKDRYHDAFDPRAGDEGHGEPLTLLWFLMKAGYRETILAETARLPATAADKVFAMLATFDDPALRAAAAKHFGLPDLPALMELVFAPRLNLEQHIAIADFGRDHPRFRTGIAVAMQSYGLHLYSNYQPTANWFLSGLEHYTMGHGCQLLFFLIHHPEDDPVLAKMIKTGWLPDGVSAGAFDAYGNVSTFYFRAASLHIGLNHLGRFTTWMQQCWLDPKKADTKGRETFRAIDALRKRLAKKTSKSRGK